MGGTKAKVIGKSALAFAGLAVASWLIQNFNYRVIFNAKESEFTALLTISVLMYIFRFFITIIYVSVLYCIFKNDKFCYKVMASNGLFLCSLLYLQTLLPYNEIRCLLFDLSMAGIPVLSLAGAFYIIKSRKSNIKKRNKTTNFVLLSIKSLAAVIYLIILEITTIYIFVYQLDLLWWIPFSYINVLWLFNAISYSFGFFLFIRRHPGYIWAVVANAAFLAIAWWFIFRPSVFPDLPGTPFIITFNLCGIAGNTAIILPALVFIFRRVEKYGRLTTGVCNIEGKRETPVGTDFQDFQGGHDTWIG